MRKLTRKDAERFRVLPRQIPRNSAIMKYKELKNKPKAELKKLLKEGQEKLRDMRFKVANRSLKNVKDIRNTKKLIARILTALNQENKNEEKK